MMNKITAIIPTFNEEVNIRGAIESVNWCDEIIVVDSFSKDRTVEIVKSFPRVRLLEHEYEHSAAQKNWTIPQATYPWIFLLDADERPTPELIEEIKAVVRSGTSYSGFWIYRRNNFMGKRINYSGWQSDKVIRLFKRNDCRYQNKHVHAEIEAKGEIGALKQKLIHYTYKDLTSYLDKADRYTTWGALDRVDKFETSHRHIGLPYLFFKPLVRFLRHYFWRLGMLDGTHGFVVSALSAYNVFIRAVKIWRLQHGEKIEDPFKK
ncbi:MAG: glycosyltransferase family 2 protein [Desulfuromonadaceae bacterium]|nr:glycosyltransferase family 2 protein [Desulfuromonadaceae bacterium]MDD5104913.1 glycosyltransferase family 2 protein [Desulfuromonadaceae bacterium]